MNAASQELARTLLRVLFIVALIAGSLWILRPFLLAGIWATTIVVATWPVMIRLRGWLRGRRSLAVGVMTGALLLVFVVPLALATLTIARNADAIVGWSRSLATFTVPSPPEWAVRLPVVGSRIEARWRAVAAAPREELAARLSPHLSMILGWFVARVGGVGLLAVEFLLTVIIASILYARGESAADAVRRFARRLAGAQGEDVVRLAGQAVRAVALGVVVTALVQSTLGGLGLLIAGVPFPLTLTAVMFLLAVAQVGVLPVLVPAVIWLYWRGDSLWATLLLVFTVAAVVLDNILRPLLIRKGADLPLLLIFAGVIGGLVVFGVIGLFVGPVVLVVSYTLLSAWVEAEESSAE